MFQDRPPTRLETMLKHPDKGYKKPFGVKGILAQVFRKILKHRDIGLSVWSNYLDHYVKGLERETGWPARSGVRGNLTKALSSEQMSILNFCRGLKFIGVKSFKLNLELTFINGEEERYESGIVVLENDESITNFDEKEDEGDD